MAHMYINNLCVLYHFIALTFVHECAIHPTKDGISPRCLLVKMSSLNWSWEQLTEVCVRGGYSWTEAWLSMLPFTGAGRNRENMENQCFKELCLTLKASLTMCFKRSISVNESTNFHYSLHKLVERVYTSNTNLCWGTIRVSFGECYF